MGNLQWGPPFWRGVEPAPKNPRAYAPQATKNMHKGILGYYPWAPEQRPVGRCPGKAGSQGMFPLLEQPKLKTTGIKKETNFSNEIIFSFVLILFFLFWF